MTRSPSSRITRISKSNNFAGPAFDLDLLKTEMFSKSGETFNIIGRVLAWVPDAGWPDSIQFESSFEYALLKARLIFPRVIFFVPIKEKSAIPIPKTIDEFGDSNILSRGGLYRFKTPSLPTMAISGNAKIAGFSWAQPDQYQLCFNQTQTSPEFEDFLTKTPS